MEDGLIRTMLLELAYCRIVAAAPLLSGPTTTWTPDAASDASWLDASVELS